MVDEPKNTADRRVSHIPASPESPPPRPPKKNLLREMQLLLVSHTAIKIGDAAFQLIAQPTVAKKKKNVNEHK